MRAIRLTGLIVVAVLMAAPEARADWFFSPIVGAASGGFLDGAKLTFGGQVGLIGDGLVGFEADYGYTAKTRGGNRRDNMRSVMGSLLIAPGRRGGWRPYASIGAGFLGAVGDFKHIFTLDDDTAENVVAMSAGGGLMTFRSERLGFRIDARYIRSLEGRDEVDGTPVIHFVRVGGGVIVRF